jgi:hypothetical protein
MKLDNGINSLRRERRHGLKAYKCGAVFVDYWYRFNLFSDASRLKSGDEELLQMSLYYFQKRS